MHVITSYEKVANELKGECGGIYGRFDGRKEKGEVL